MRHEPISLPAAVRAARLNDGMREASATDILSRVLKDGAAGRVALVSSFGAEAVVLLHMAASIDRAVPVLFVDTEMLFAETLEYQEQVTRRLGLRNVRHVRANADRLAAADPRGQLHRDEPDACCTLRKSEPLARALAPFDAWITGRKRYQSGRRADLDIFEAEDGADRVKINPLVHWRRDDVLDYMDAHGLPRHPLVARGYASIGCAPCTTPVAPGEDARAGRWRGHDKEECGIHFAGGRVVRGPDRKAS